MASINKVILIGNVGKDPEIKYLDKDVAVAKFSLATSETYTNKNGEKVTNTDWHNIVLWRGLANIAEKYVKKGTSLYVEGKIKTRTYQDENNNTKYIVEIVGDNIQLLGKKESSDSENSYSKPENNNTSTSNDFASDENSSDDLPF